MTDEFNFDNFEDLESDLTTYTLDDALEALRSDVGYNSAAVSYGLSDMSLHDMQRFQTHWNTLNADTKYQLIQHLIEVSETNFELNYRTLGLMAIDDTSDIVRAHAVELLWEDETEELLERLISMAQWDSSNQVRAMTVNALGRFILLGEYGKIKPGLATQAQEVAIHIWNNPDEDVIVRCRALEAISNSSRDFVNESIDEAYHSTNHQIVVSSIYAMGRSCDPAWAPIVLKELSNENPDIRYEAAKASGELEMQAAIPALRQIALSDERDIQEVAIWALGEIGGDEAVKALNFLDEHLPEDSWATSIDEAVANANLGMMTPDLLNFQDEDL